MPRLHASHRRFAQTPLQNTAEATGRTGNGQLVLTAPPPPPPQRQQQQLEDRNRQHSRPLRKGGGALAEEHQQQQLSRVDIVAEPHDASCCFFAEVEGTADRPLRRAEFSGPGSVGDDDDATTTTATVATARILESLFAEEGGGREEANAPTSLPSITASPTNKGGTNTDQQTSVGRHGLPRRRVRPTATIIANTFTTGLQNSNDRHSSGKRSTDDWQRSSSEDAEEEEEELFAEGVVDGRAALLPSAPCATLAAAPHAHAGAAPALSDTSNSPAREGGHDDEPMADRPCALSQLRAPPAAATSHCVASASIITAPSAEMRREVPPVADRRVPLAEEEKRQTGWRCTTTSLISGSSWRVHVWVPRRVEALCEPARRTATSSPSSAVPPPPLLLPATGEATGNAQRGPQPVIWRRPDSPHLHPQRTVEHAALHAAPSPLSSTQWCVTAFEVVEVCLYTADCLHTRCRVRDTPRSSSSNSSKQSTNSESDEPLRSDDDDDDDSGGDAAVPTGVPEASRVPLSATTYRQTSPPPPLHYRGCQVGYRGAPTTSREGRVEEEEEEEAAAAATGGGKRSRAIVGCQRPQRASSSSSGNDRRVRRVERGGGCTLCNAAQPHAGGGEGGSRVNTFSSSSLSPPPPPSSSPRNSAWVPLRAKLATDIRITLSWLLHACTLPPLASTMLTRCVEAYINTCVVVAVVGGRQAAATTAPSSTPPTTSHEHAPSSSSSVFSPPSSPQPVPFWIAAFAYTHDIQSRATTFASRLLHEADVAPAAVLNSSSNKTASTTPISKPPPQGAIMRSQRSPPSAATETVTCILWPHWVPDVRWSTQVLTALMSAAFVLINDVAQALTIATTSAATPEQFGKHADAVSSSTADGRRGHCTMLCESGPGMTPLAAASSPLAALLRRLHEFHVFCDIVFGDAENKKLCRHVRDRLPVHISDLSELLSRPWCQTEFSTEAKTKSATETAEATRTTGGKRASPPFDASTTADEDGYHRTHVFHPPIPPSACDVGSGQARLACPPPLAAADGSSRTRFTSSSTAAPQTSATRWPSVLDLVHHLAHAWMRQCFPTLASDLQAFLISHDPGVMVDEWNRRGDGNNAPPERGGVDCVAASTSTQARNIRNDAADRRACADGAQTKLFTAASPQDDLHDRMYRCIHDFVQGVLHRWGRWYDTSGAASATAPRLPSPAFGVSPAKAATCAYGTDLQWRAHVNYATMQSLQWLLLRQRSRLCVPNALEADSGSPTNPSAVVVADVKAMLEQLTLLPTLFGTVLRSQEIRSGLRCACAEVAATAAEKLTAPHSVDDSSDSFHACFRLFWGMVCYGASMLQHEDVVDLLCALPQPSFSPASSSTPRLSKLHDGSASAVTAGTQRQRQRLACAMETAGGVWKEWILPLLARYFEGSRSTERHDNAGEHAEGEVAEANAADTHAEAARRTEAFTPPAPLANAACSSPPRPACSALDVADQMVMYALTLLRQIRDAQRGVATGTRTPRSPRATAAATTSTTTPSVTSSRKRHRHCSTSASSCTTNRRHQRSFPRRRVCGSGDIGLMSHAGQGVCVRPCGEDGEVDSSSLCSPRSVSSSATFSTATATTTVASSLARHNQSSCIGGCGIDTKGRTTPNAAGSGEGAATQNSLAERATGAAAAADGAASAMRVAGEKTRAAPEPRRSSAWVIPSLRCFTNRNDTHAAHPDVRRDATELSHHPLPASRTTSPVEPDWRDVCRVVAHQWMSRPSPCSPQNMFPHSTTPQSSNGSVGHVIHRRDVRFTRAFLLCLRQCIQQLQEQQQQQQADQDQQQQRQREGEEDGAQTHAHGHLSGDDNAHHHHSSGFRSFYDYLYGVLPPGLRAEEGGVMVLEVASSSSSPPSSSPSLSPISSLLRRGAGAQRVQHSIRRRAGRRRHPRRLHSTHHNHDDEVLHLTSTDSLSADSQSSADSAKATITEGADDDEGQDGRGGAPDTAASSLRTPSSSTTFVSSLSAPSPSTPCSSDG
ncbi:putative PTP1-interacting protein 39 kDa [Leptomonas pyrrhocoris]|uniref:Putative PTP1-interacting protein 39 kDa n=1 Tax=Leptomonas pyrrhocoris TaxID=157538 RepID=A0A0N0VCT2_LEPPY|nr:putative PTP1-interacting protein 39 kDa [Leptomonas pyrrhocoris]KPA73621.1 putative PTP1-interacting protein 39 kDa [Leptomonas pyrrhocoris]|eukprot:XP_015652060.1 putative PTP1-interacting protein 39 kDa [Leptomonas pyrrhocoris]